MSTFRLLQFAAGVSSFDRFVTPALLVAMATDLDTSLAVMSGAATLYFVLYAVLQPVWAVVSDFLGRIAVVRLALLAAGCSAVVCVLSDDVEPVILARALSGGMLAAVVPAALVWIGDTVPEARRRATLARLLGATYLGTLVASVVGAAAAQLSVWQFAVALSAVASLAVGVALLRVPGRTAAPRHKPDVRFLRRPQVLLVIGVAFTEGAVVHGTLTYWPAVLELLGARPVFAGLAVGSFGLGVILGSRYVSRTIRSRGRVTFVGGATIGAALLAASFAPALGAAAMLGVAGVLGAGFSALHSSLQNWATEVAPEARALVVAFFVAAMFIGGAAGAALAAGPVSSGRFEPAFLIAAALSVPMTAVAVMGRGSAR